MASTEKTSGYKPVDQYRPGDVVLSNDRIQTRYPEVAQEIAERYKGKNLLIVGIMKGALIVMADLSRELHRAGLDDQEWSLITISMYRNGTEAEEEPRLLQDMDISPQGRHVLLVDEVFDSGVSLEFAYNLVNSRNPASLASCVLVEKDGTSEVGFKPDYVIFPNAPKVWMEGVGMDTNQKGRGNPNVIVGQERI